MYIIYIIDLPCKNVRYVTWHPVQLIHRQMDLFIVNLFLVYICITLSLENTGNVILYLTIDKKRLSHNPETLHNNHKKQTTEDEASEAHWFYNILYFE